MFPESKGLFRTCFSVKIGREKAKMREKGPYNMNPAYVFDLNLVEQILAFLKLHTNTSL
jgi:hypothetical protein